MNTAPSVSGHRIPTHSLGHPRIGERRELKQALEAFWQGSLDREGLEAVARDLRRRHWFAQRDAGIDLIPSNDFSFYDQVLDLTCLVGNIPPRFGWTGGEVGLDTRFAIARGLAAVSPSAPPPPATPAAACSCGRPHDPGAGPTPALASEMTKWFDTNYHYIVPEFRSDTVFALSSTKIFDEFSEALALGLRTKPVLVGPVTYLALGKVHDARQPGFDRFALLDRLLPVYAEILRKLAGLGAEWV